MKVYNKDKTQILETYDLTKGYLKEDVITIHFEEVKAVREQGHYETISEYANGGKDIKWVVDVKGVKYQPSRDEEQMIQVYIPYTSLELEERRKDKLRQKRKPLLDAFDIWEKAVLRGREIDSTDIMKWYQSILDLDENSLNAPPQEIRRYM